MTINGCIVALQGKRSNRGHLHHAVAQVGKFVEKKKLHIVRQCVFTWHCFCLACAKAEITDEFLTCPMLLREYFYLMVFIVDGFKRVKSV